MVTYTLCKYARFKNKTKQNLGMLKPAYYFCLFKAIEIRIITSKQSKNMPY